MRDYFLQFDYWDTKRTFNKFYFGVVRCDMSSNKLIDVCKEVLQNSKEFTDLPHVSVDDIVIKVNALNNVDT